jgi:hypothetical protein
VRTVGLRNTCPQKTIRTQWSFVAKQGEPNAGTFPPFSASFFMTAEWSQMFIAAESSVDPV